MKESGLFHRLKAPCGKCPYKLGLIRTFVSPCPECRADNYRTYEHFKDMRNNRDQRNNKD